MSVVENCIHCTTSVFCVKMYATISAVMGHRPLLVVKLPYISHGSVITHV